MPIVLFVATLLFFFAQSAQAQPQLRMATLEYPPYSSEHLPDGGSIVALTRRAFAVRGYPLQIDFLPWARARVELGNGNYQGALALWPKEINEEGLQPSRPLFYSELGLFIRNGYPLQFSQLQELRGRTLGIVRGYGYPQHILDAGLTLEDAVDDISNLRKLNARRFDMVLLERIVGNHLIGNDEQLRGKLSWQGNVLERVPLLVGFVPAKPGEPDWSAVFEQGLRDLHSSGEYMQILRSHNP
ncbi:MAG: substrate-binding periplasmic protein [Gammaproteobacteria bacterium]|jgi:polar amino acid transport system substrate-binding protein|uniref:substrate-binding periplasmic protein n=2 Tax=Pseudomonas TaxID=286 RepID=UPI0024AD6AFF|nr:transporter substrate-binding domain-containing protein [Pseudomonas peli]